MNKTTSKTVRPPVHLPPMPGEREAAKTYLPIPMARSQIIGERLVFDETNGFTRALAQGFFLVRIPEGVDTTAGDLFAANFFKSCDGGELDCFKGYRNAVVPGEYQGYFDRENDQWENFYIELANWALLPSDVTLLGHQMTDIGIKILRNVLKFLDIPQCEWTKLTSGLSNKLGHQMLAFNHFRSDKPMRGSKFHRDSGWVTVLRSTEPGLLALVEGKLGAINPEPGYFIVNFGSSIEVLTEGFLTPVHANVHGVARTEREAGQAERISYVVFLDSNLAGTIYRYENGKPQALQSVAEFAVQEVSRTYDNNDRDL